MAKQCVPETQPASTVDAIKRKAATWQETGAKSIATWQETGAKTIELRVGQAKSAAAVATKKTSEVAELAKKRSLELVSDRGVQVAAVSAVGGGAVVGAGGAATGFITGGALGAAIGVVPALFTFGLSIPVGAALGAGCGVAVGGTVGGATGFTGAGAIGYGAYAKRAEISALRVKLLAAVGRAAAAASAGKKRAVSKVLGTVAATRKETLRQVGLIRERGIALLGVTMEKSTKAKAKAKVIVSDKEVQRTAASAAGGAAVVGAGGAATGLLAGGAVGAAVGVVPALFTFGLSIPFCAVMGSGLGLVAGTSVGGTAGAVAGAGGYRVYTKREAIKKYVGDLRVQALTSAQSFRAKLKAA